MLTYQAVLVLRSTFQVDVRGICHIFTNNLVPFLLKGVCEEFMACRMQYPLGQSPYWSVRVPSITYTYSPQSWTWGGKAAPGENYAMKVDLPQFPSPLCSNVTQLIPQTGEGKAGVVFRGMQATSSKF